MAMNPPTTVTFESKAEALEHFEVLGFKFLPVRSPIERRVAKSYDDEGNRILIFASSAGTDEATGTVSYHFVEQFLKGG